MANQETVEPTADREGRGQDGLLLIAASFIVLFQELALIRWVGAEVRVLAYFPNVILISAFLGLGIGAMRAGSRSLLWMWPVSIGVLVAATILLGRVAFTHQSPTEHLWLLYADIPGAPVIRDVRPPIVILFALSTITFLPLGQLVGTLLRKFTERRMTLWGYVTDLSGSLLGVVAFAAASFYQTFPAAWFALFLGLGLILFARERRLLPLHLAATIGVVAVIAFAERADRYSPYYALRPVRTAHLKGVQILANGSLHQYAAPIVRAEASPYPHDAVIRAGYPVPYRALRFRPDRVLVLGAGTGNDVATALAAGAGAIDAVEIDPVIIDYGRRLHPDRPYASERVRVFNTDARAYLRNTSERYDLIVFGTLDSMTRLSALSNVRLDNFVYTLDCILSARDRLTPRGGIALYFMVGKEFIEEKLHAMLTLAFGDPPIVHRKFHLLFNQVFFAGPAFHHLRGPDWEKQSLLARQAVMGVDVPTDDWPFLYLESRAPTSFYLSLMAVFVAVAWGAAWLVLPEQRRDWRSRFDSEMFLFGMAFLLLETKLVTQMTLVWGTTWVTSAVVFGSILLMILAGTLAMQYRTIPYGAACVGLALSLVSAYLVPTSWLLAGEIPSRLLLSALYVGVPVAFSSICFAIRFKARRDTNLAFGWNLAGAVVGGLIEFLSMVFGIRAMTLIALAAYLVAFLLAHRSDSGRGRQFELKIEN